MNYGSANNVNYRVQFYISLSQNSPEIYYRRRTGTSSNPTWSEWVKIYALADMKALIDGSIRTTSDSFIATSMSAQGNNTGLNLRVMSYNVANFDNDTANYISDEKLFNLKKAIMSAKVDFICGQEDRQYIDSENTKLSNNYVYFPVFPNRYGDGGVVIHSKIQAQEQSALDYTNGRILRYATFNLSNGIKLLLINTHPVGDYNSTGAESTESIDARKTQYEELFKWINGTITLNRNGTSTSVSVPEFTHCIIGMDGNSITAEDKTNLLNEVSGSNFIAGNGGTIGWFLTNFVHNYSIDNIIVSNNIIINNIEAWSDWYDKLYSDHVPVIADLTLLES
jgi:endonuclease/exonuclease/phosphatase family metal-dependent hydrolase